MSYAMTHLIIAQRVAEEWKIQNKGLFLLASVSPDAVHSRDDFTFQIKADAHDLQKEEKWGEIYTKKSMDIWYDRVRIFYQKKSDLVKNQKEKDFLKGYVLHLLVDIFNCKLLYATNLMKYQFDVDAMREEYRRECILQDNYLYQTCGRSEEIFGDIEEALQKEDVDEILKNLELDSYISMKNIEDNMSYLTNSYQNAASASLDGLEMVSVEGSEFFLEYVTKEALRLLFTFPEAENTFSVVNTEQNVKENELCETADRDKTCEVKKTLYVSDLDGTLLHSNEEISDYTNEVINRLTKEGMLFSYATARSLITAKKVTGKLKARIPLIVYNGAFIIDNVTEEILASNYFDDSILTVLDELFQNDIYPLVYAYVNGVEKFSFVRDLCTEGLNRFLNSRKGDIRTNAVLTKEELKLGNIFYITCIDETEKLRPFYEKWKDKYHCVFQKDIYTHDQWFEILPVNASKSHAIEQLKKLLDCDRLVVFGDGKNDIDMFQTADEALAVANAHEELKKYATGVIASNNEDGVAKFLEERWGSS